MASPSITPTQTPPIATALPPPPEEDASSSPPNADSPPPPSEAPLASLPSDLLEEIFLRLPTATDLARASAACASFRAITAALSFRRRFRALHKPPVIGFLRDDFYPAQPPHASAPAARALAQDADFTFSFLPDAACWSLRDARDGRVLFSAVPSSQGLGNSPTFVDLVVGDPLSRRYVLIPPVPDDLAASVQECGMLNFEPFLGPASAEDLREDDSPFRVIAKVLCHNKVAVFAFSSRTGKWRGHGSSVLSNDIALHALHERRHYVQGCFCWLLEWVDKLLMLDADGMEFSIIDLPVPPGTDVIRFAILEAGQGRIGLLNISRKTLDLYYTNLRNKGDGAQEWQHSTVDHRLPDYHWRIIGSDEEFLLLKGISLRGPWLESPDIEYFALGLKELRLERMYVSKHKMLHAHLYRGFPPNFSAPSI